MAWARARSDSPRWMRAAASPRRMRPAAMIGLAARAPPDGLTRTLSSSSRALRRTTSWEVKGACSSAVSTGRSKAPARSAASRVDGRVGEVAHAEAVGLDAVVHAADPGGACAQLAGACPRRRGPRRPRRRRWAGSRRCAAAVRGTSPCGHRAPRSWACGLAAASLRLRAATAARARLVGVARVDQRLGLEGGEGDGVGPQRGDVVRVELAGQDVAHGSPGEDLP